MDIDMDLGIDSIDEDTTVESSVGAWKSLNYIAMFPGIN